MSEWLLPFLAGCFVGGIAVTWVAERFMAARFREAGLAAPAPTALNVCALCGKRRQNWIHTKRGGHAYADEHAPEEEGQ